VKILFFIAPKDFRDEEYFIPQEIFLKKGFQTFTASTIKEVAIGKHGGEVDVDFLFTEIGIKDYNAIVFVGGEGAIKYLDNEETYNIIKKITNKTLLAAICISPLILANAGVLEGKKATVWSSPLLKSPVTILKEKGAFYINEDVVCDGNVITANGPEAAEQFALKIIDNLTKNNI
jgi:protease I